MEYLLVLDRLKNTTANIMVLTDSGKHNHTLFHRSPDDFIIPPYVARFSALDVCFGPADLVPIGTITTVVEGVPMR